MCDSNLIQKFCFLSFLPQSFSSYAKLYAMLYIFGYLISIPVYHRNINIFILERKKSVTRAVHSIKINITFSHQQPSFFFAMFHNKRKHFVVGRQLEYIYSNNSSPMRIQQISPVFITILSEWDAIIHHKMFHSMPIISIQYSMNRSFRSQLNIVQWSYTHTHTFIATANLSNGHFESLSQEKSISAISSSNLHIVNIWAFGCEKGTHASTSDCTLRNSVVQRKKEKKKQRMWQKVLMEVCSFLACVCVYVSVYLNHLFDSHTLIGTVKMNKSQHRRFFIAFQQRRMNKKETA